MGLNRHSGSHPCLLFSIGYGCRRDFHSDNMGSNLLAELNKTTRSRVSCGISVVADRGLSMKVMRPHFLGAIRQSSNLPESITAVLDIVELIYGADLGQPSPTHDDVKDFAKWRWRPLQNSFQNVVRESIERFTKRTKWRTPGTVSTSFVCLPYLSRLRSIASAMT